MRIIFLIMCIVSVGYAQHKLPFASQNNRIELSVANTSSIATSNVVVAVTSAPQWLKFTEKEQKFSELSSQSSSLAHFSFSVDKLAPVNKSEEVTFTIINSNGERWTKTLLLQVSAPEKFELFQNYPNPFNPSTTISYQLPADSKVRITIYNTLGQEITTLFDGIRSAGYYQEVWNARSVASGMYIYQITSESNDGKKEHARKTMILVK